MKKKIIDKRLKVVLILLLSILLSSLLGLIYIELYIPDFIQERKEIFTYKDNISLSAETMLIDNCLYKENISPELIITHYIDYMNIYYSLDYESSIKQSIRSEYRIKYIVEGYTKDEKGDRIIFSKEYYPIGDYPIYQSGKFSGEVRFDFHEFKEFVEFISNNADIGFSSRIRIQFLNSINAVNEFKEIKHDSLAELIVPLDESYFTIEGNKSIDFEDNHNKEKNIKIGPDIKIVQILGTASLMISILLLIAILKFKGVNKKNLRANMIKKIFRKYGNIMVAVDRLIITSDYRMINVSSIKDLVRLSDEIRKPIMYTRKQKMVDIDEFYIHDNTTVYLYRIIITDKKKKGKKDKTIKV